MGPKNLRAWFGALLSVLGFEQIEGHGSKVKFDNGNPDQMINLHKPHPQK